MKRPFRTPVRLPAVLPAVWIGALALLLGLASPASAQIGNDPPIEPVPLLCQSTVEADIVAFDQVFFWNRLGAVQPQGMIYALRADVVPKSGTQLAPGNVRLRELKRPRPIVLRVNVGDCIRITFTNYLNPQRVDENQSATRYASVHAIGMELVNSIDDDGSYVGKNASSLAAVGQTKVYTLYAEREGQHVMYSQGTSTGGEGDGGHINSGLFGAINVEPRHARWYRSQVTEEDLSLATVGTTASGHPIIDWEKRYPTSHPRAGIPILNMRDGNTIVHTDLTAIITGSPPNQGGDDAGFFASNAFPPNIYTHPDRFEPFREFTIIYHDEIGAVQAFELFEDEVFEHTLHSGRDAFAINYGTGGIGAEVLANRFGVGPMWDCEACKYEEFFLTAWAVGDPAMVVDVPANTPCMVETDDPNEVDAEDPDFELLVEALRGHAEELGVDCGPDEGPKATKAFFPDDPSNVYHGYLRDHTRFRILHAGSKEHHIHHLHAHQWLYSGDSDNSAYLDSQAIGPGSAFTLEIAYEGGGNKNLTVGDSIFHCHFYPHFAQGMWALWRVHDVFEAGTELDETGRPDDGARALPDGEILAGTPIPAIVPLPGKPMAPLPSAVSIANGQIVNEDAAVLLARQQAGQGRWNPGFPFYIPGLAGKRPPTPPLDAIHDGGLPRHLIVDSNNIDEAHTRLDFHKILLDAQPLYIPEAGTPYEQLAMDYHAIRKHETCEPSGLCNPVADGFVTNGQPAVAGAPYAEPCIDLAGNPQGTLLRYKAADIQDDVFLNKEGWHFGQQRYLALWEDVGDFLGGTRPPEPLFFRANSREHCIEYWLTNLVPHEYDLDDFQVRTPTDILGQHIHLVKFDVTSSDGAANGYNYEDGTLSPAEVRERIEAIRAWNNCSSTDVGPNCPEPEIHPFFGPGPNHEWVGAQTTVQRWYADPVLDNQGVDRTLRTVFTHDHFGPSTHQQAGLYAGLVVEKEGSVWSHNETGVVFGTRHDGGPTSWQAVIEGPEVFREFLIEFADFQLAYWGDDPVNPPARKEAGLHKLIEVAPECPGGVPRPCPELISADDVGTMSVNYRNEPLALRVRDPNSNDQAAGLAGDFSYAFSSQVDRADNLFDVQPNFYPPLTQDLKPRDPYTPLIRAYENDRVQIRVLVGAHEEGHNFSINGIKWLFEPSEPNSGYRGSQMMGISEHFEFIVPQVIKGQVGSQVDRLWSAGSATDDYWNGIWGLFRTYKGTRPDLETLSTNPNGRAFLAAGTVGEYDFSCPKNAPVRNLDVTAVAAFEALPGGRITYNTRVDHGLGPLFDPTGIVYVRTSDLQPGVDPPKLKTNVPVEPLILRARAGECIHLTLRNRLPDQLLEVDGWNTLPLLVDDFNANDIAPSRHVGLNPQMLYYDVSRFDATNVGLNRVQTVAPGASRTYEWYAGDLIVHSNGSVTPTPIEFGATNLISSDRMEHPSKGAIGALIIEPQGAFWRENPKMRAEAKVRNPNATARQQAQFKEYVLLFQNDVNLRKHDSEVAVSILGDPVRNLAVGDGEIDAEDTGAKALNYRTEPLWKRMGHAVETPLAETDDFDDWWDVLSNLKVGTIDEDPQTPLFHARAGQKIRFRLLQPGGHARNGVFALHGHVWDQEPYVGASTKIGTNNFSFWEGARMGHGPTNHFDAVMRHGAGGLAAIRGDFLYRNQGSFDFDGGQWGILRVDLETPLWESEEPEQGDPALTQTNVSDPVATPLTTNAGDE